MKVRIVWKSRHGRRPVDTRHARLRSVLLAALNTPFYRPVLYSSALCSPEDIAELGSIDEALARLPSVNACAPGVHSSALLNRGGGRGLPHELHWPLPPAARTAVLMEGFRESREVRVFRELRRLQLARYGPQALAGPVSELRKLAEGVEDRGEHAPPLEHSVLAFSVLRQAFLSEEARDLLWRVFKVPVFGQILSPGGALLAWECEAHQGYHVAIQNAIFETEYAGRQPELLVTSLVDFRRPVLRMSTGLTGRMEQSCCGCGLAGPRLLEVCRRSNRQFARAAAASASCAAD